MTFRSFLLDVLGPRVANHDEKALEEFSSFHNGWFDLERWELMRKVIAVSKEIDDAALDVGNVVFGQPPAASGSGDIAIGTGNAELQKQSRHLGWALGDRLGIDGHPMFLSFLAQLAARPAPPVGGGV